MNTFNPEQSTAIRGAQVLFLDTQVETDVVFANGHIVEIGTDAPADHVIDGRGLVLAPALIDVHGDAFERQIAPRPNVYFPLDAAVLETDRQLAANGIATAYHAVTLSWEPGLRSVDKGRALIKSINDLAARLTVENRIQLRWETFAFEAIELLEETLKADLTPSIAFNDHTSMTLRSFDTPVQQRAFEQSPDFLTTEISDPRLKARIAGPAKRSGLSEAEYTALLSEVWQRRGDVGTQIQKIANIAAAQGAPMLSHDDTQAETRNYYRNLGSNISEFPMVQDVTQSARDNGDFIIFGAPNAVRGGSHMGSLGAGDMVEAGLCDILASDYFYPAMLAAVARLEQERRASRPALWQLISTGPAKASKLTDRGEIAVGKRADLVLVDWPEQGTPAIRATFSGGRQAYASMPLKS